MRMRHLIPATTAIALAIAALAFTPKDDDDYYYKVNRGLELFGEVYREIASSYVDEIDPEEFIRAGIDGMLGSLDPYTTYMRSRESADIELLSSGYYAGIGISVGMRDSALTIVDVADGYSAQREGLRIGDRIIAVDGRSVAGIPADSLREYTRGDANTTLRLTVRREGTAEPLSFTLMRENIDVHSVTFSGLVSGGAGYIKLDRFGADAGDEVADAIERLREAGANGIVLDLRDNPGGLLQSAVDVASKLVPGGSTIVTTRGRDSSETRVYRSTEQPILGGLPLVVLVNGNSASAAEIVAGAVQDLDAGVIIGSRTFGKGLVQSVRRLPHDATLKLTTARYYTPSGRCIQRAEYTSQAHLAPREDPSTRTIAYHTSNGRTVTAMGGVMPDSAIGSDDTGSVVSRLLRSSAFFNFATRYAAARSGVSPEFRLTDAEFREFEEHVARTFATSPEDNPAIGRVRDLLATAEASGHTDELLRSIRSMESQIVAQTRRSVTEHREEIRGALEAEIIGRFHGQQARIEASLLRDRSVQAGVGLIRKGRGGVDRLLSAK